MCYTYVRASECCASTPPQRQRPCQCRRRGRVCRRFTSRPPWQSADTPQRLCIGPSAPARRLGTPPQRSIALGLCCSGPRRTPATHRPPAMRRLIARCAAQVARGGPIARRAACPLRASLLAAPRHTVRRRAPLPALPHANALVRAMLATPLQYILRWRRAPRLALPLATALMKHAPLAGSCRATRLHPVGAIRRSRRGTARRL